MKTFELLNTTFNDVETTWCISMLNWTILGNVKQCCRFQRRFSQRWAKSKQRCEYDHFKKKR